MSVEKGKSETLEFISQVPTVEIKPHPKEVLDLDEETVAIARAKLAGVDFQEIYGDEDRTSPGLMIQTQVTRIRELYRNPDEIRQAFSTPQKIAQAYKDMTIDGIDLDFIRSYCSKRQLQVLDDAHVLIAIAFPAAKSGDVNV